MSTNEPVESKSTDQAGPSEEAPKPSKSKKLWVLAAGLVLLLGGGVAYWLWTTASKKAVVTTTPTPSASVAPAAKKLVVVSDGFALKAVDPETNEFEGLYTPDAATRAEICKVAGCEVGGSMKIDLSPDNTKVALDGLAKDGKRMVGYFDIKAKQVVMLVHGFDPQWSPDGKSLAYYDEQGVKAISLADGKVATIENTAPAVDQHGVMTQVPAVWGWRSATEIVFWQGGNVARFHIGNIATFKNTEVMVTGLQAEDSIRGAVMSRDGQKLLLDVDLDPGYDVGLVGVDGKGFARVTGNQASRWPGSGYSAAAFSPEPNRVLVINNFIPADGSVKRASGEYEIHGPTGQKLGSIAGYRGISNARACWFSPNLIYLSYTLDAGENYLGRYDISASKMTPLGAVDVDSQITCEP